MPESPLPLTRAEYDRLKRAAERLLARERRGHTLQPTALVHEAWVRLARQRRREFGAEDTGGIVRAAAGAMRLALVDHARRRGAAKRRIAPPPASGEGRADANGPSLELLEALGRLEPELAIVVELRFVRGLQDPEVARALGVSTRTVRRRWRVAKAALAESLGGEAR